MAWKKSYGGFITGSILRLPILSSSLPSDRGKRLLRVKLLPNLVSDLSATKESFLLTSTSCFERKV